MDTQMMKNKTSIHWTPGIALLKIQIKSPQSDILQQVKILVQEDRDICLVLLQMG